jgi:iron complex outermembrane receptor protein
MRITTPTLLLTLVVGVTDARSQTTQPDLARATLEELLNVEITSASRKEQRADQAPAAVYVITQDDIRRSGITVLPEVFRLVPGMQVAQINSSDWAISVRGFNDLWSNKLLVLVDGRSIFTREFSGVLWNAQDLMLEDIDRIEVIRGPGGTVWGANAVNGVINIITKSANDTKGAFVRLGGGSYAGADAAVRYGGSFGNTAYRVYSQWSDHGQSESAPQVQANDAWNRLTNGFRTDWAQGGQAVTLEGNLTTGQTRPLWLTIPGPTPSLSTSPIVPGSVTNGSILGRWTHGVQETGALQVQSFFSYGKRVDGNGVAEREQTADIDVQYHQKLAARHDLVMGGGFRTSEVAVDGAFPYTIDDTFADSHVWNAFLEDDISVSRSVQVVLGSKVEHYTYGGWGVQPTARVAWEMVPQKERVWASFSRAIRTPSANDLGIRAVLTAFPGSGGFPVVVALVGNPNYQNEELIDVEGGYRLELAKAASIDVTVFRGHYNGLTTNEPLPPFVETTPGPPHLLIPVQQQNLLAANTSGVEVASHWSPLTSWRFDASYSNLRIDPMPDPASRDPAAPFSDGNAPASQWQLHSSFWPRPRLEVDGGLFHVGRLRSLGVPAYTRADARAELKISKPLSLVAVGQNLLESTHAEYAGFATGLNPTLIPRSFDIRLLWRF